MRWLLVLTLIGCGTLTDSIPAGDDLRVISLRHDYNNSHLLKRGDSLILVDAGLQESAEALDAQIRDAGVDPASIEAVVVTHGHADHAGGAHWFRERYGARIVAGAGDREMLATGRNDELCPTGFIAETRLEDDQDATYDPLEADLLLEAPIPLSELADIPGRIVPLAGHTAGSLVVVSGEVAFIGDLVRGAIVGPSAELHFYMCDLADNRADVRRLLDELAPDAETFFVGHFGPLSRRDLEDLLARDW